MLSLILKVIGVVDTAMMLSVTLSICGIFALVYVLIFMITSRAIARLFKYRDRSIKKATTEIVVAF